MKRKVLLIVVAVVLAVTLIACQLTSLVPTAVAPTPTATSTVLPPVSQSGTSGDEEARLIAIYLAVNPGVVTIQTSNALGSGWVYSSDGYIVTNQHVVESETQVEVDFVSGYKTYGTVVGTDPNSDLAVIKVDVPAEELHPLSLGDSDLLQVGQTVVAIGDPLTLNGTMTAGIVSALGRSEDSNAPTSGGGYFAAGDFIETDALLNHGNSGGPLLNLDGQVVGVNRSIQLDPTTGVSSGLGYAISVNIVKRVVPELIEKGKFDYPYLGLSTYDNFPLSVIQELGLQSTTGAYITAVSPGGPAEQAGLVAGTQPTSIQGLYAGGDLIIAVDGQPAKVFADALRYIVLHKSPGDTITLTILRGDQQMDIPLTLGTRP